jgi:hypothetical protein
MPPSPRDHEAATALRLAALTRVCSCQSRTNGGTDTVGEAHRLTSVGFGGFFRTVGVTRRETKLGQASAFCRQGRQRRVHRQTESEKPLEVMDFRNDLVVVNQEGLEILFRGLLRVVDDEVSRGVRQGREGANSRQMMFGLRSPHRS